jgi:hypothetical protein
MTAKGNIQEAERETVPVNKHCTFPTFTLDQNNLSVSYFGRLTPSKTAQVLDGHGIRYGRGDK